MESWLGKYLVWKKSRVNEFILDPDEVRYVNMFVDLRKNIMQMIRLSVGGAWIEALDHEYPHNLNEYLEYSSAYKRMLALERR